MEAEESLILDAAFAIILTLSFLLAVGLANKHWLQKGMLADFS